MAQDSEQSVPPSDFHITDLPIVEELQDSYLTYAMSVIISRALPDARDGLKPSQRRILVAMHDLNLGPRTKHLKCAKIAGQTSGDYHPHGESVIYPTLVRLGQAWNLRYTLVDGQGNFGSMDGDPPAAMRYTEARMTAAAAEMLTDIKMETVDFEPNYDERLEEPVVLPAKFPNLLVNGTTGIAVGMATNMPPHNIGEMTEAIVKVIDNPKVTIDELMQVLPGPDFPTGGYICGRRGIAEAYKTGRGSIVLRGKTHTEELRNKTLIVVDEIPYQVLRSTIRDKIVACIKSGQLSDVSDVRDESDRKHATRLVVELKRDGNRRRGPQPALPVHASADQLHDHEHRDRGASAADAEHSPTDRHLHRSPQGRHPETDAVPAPQGPAASPHCRGLAAGRRRYRRDHRADQDVARSGDRQAAAHGPRLAAAGTRGVHQDAARAVRTHGDDRRSAADRYPGRRDSLHAAPTAHRPGDGEARRGVCPPLRGDRGLRSHPA